MYVESAKTKRNCISGAQRRRPTDGALPPGALAGGTERSEPNRLLNIT